MLKSKRGRKKKWPKINRRLNGLITKRLNKKRQEEEMAKNK